MSGLLIEAFKCYRYQTGALTPLIRWIQRGGAPPQPRPAVHREQPHRHANDNQPQPGEYSFPVLV